MLNNTHNYSKVQSKPLKLLTNAIAVLVSFIMLCILFGPNLLAVEALVIIVLSVVVHETGHAIALAAHCVPFRVEIKVLGISIVTKHETVKALGKKQQILFALSGSVLSGFANILWIALSQPFRMSLLLSILMICFEIYNLLFCEDGKILRGVIDD